MTQGALKRTQGEMKKQWLQEANTRRHISAKHSRWTGHHHSCSLVHLSFEFLIVLLMQMQMDRVSPFPVWSAEMLKNADMDMDMR